MGIQSTPQSTPTATRSGAGSTANKRPNVPPRQISSMQIVFGAILAISLLLAINFSGRIAAGRRIEAERGELMGAIASLEAHATALHTELNFVNSDAFIEQWARRDGRMIRDDEMLVVPVPAQSTPQPAPTLAVVPAAAEESSPQNWQLWWQLFFDLPPPTRN